MVAWFLGETVTLGETRPLKRRESRAGVGQGSEAAEQSQSARHEIRYTFVGVLPRSMFGGRGTAHGVCLLHWATEHGVCQLFWSWNESRAAAGNSRTFVAAIAPGASAMKTSRSAAADDLLREALLATGGATFVPKSRRRGCCRGRSGTKFELVARSAFGSVTRSSRAVNMHGSDRSD